MAGVRDALRTAADRLEAMAVRRLEQRYLGVYTGDDIPSQELGYGPGMYKASSWLVLAEIFRRLEVGEDDVFVDIGSGMGRAVLMAARRPFRRVIGVEQSPRLNQVAQGIVDRNRHRLACQHIELVTVDTLEWEIPDDLTVVYLYCPFPEQTFSKLVERLVASIERSPRPLRLIYYFSTVEDRDDLRATGQAEMFSFGVPRYLRSEFEEVSMFRLLPRGDWRTPA
jgi:SAM-dependent methyltransferase